MGGLKKSEMIDLIQSLKGFQTPKIKLEQYQTDAIATSDLIFHIAFESTAADFENRLIIDLGCGTGNLSIAVALLGYNIVSVDIDKNAISILKENAELLGVLNQIYIIQTDLRKTPLKDIITEHQHEIQSFFSLSKIPEKTTVLTNPPFGVHQKGIDVQFLKQALSVANIVYSIHLATEENRAFLEKKIQQMGGKVTERAYLHMVLPASYKFHKKDRKKIKTLMLKSEIIF